MIEPTPKSPRKIKSLESMPEGLGIYTNYSANLVPRGFQSSDNLTYTDSLTGEVKNFELKNGRYVESFDPFLFRFQKYMLQASSRECVKGMKTKSGQAYRVTNCLRSIVSPDNLVSVYRTIEHNQCTYSGLMTCGSVWLCPVCASKITERRSIIIERVIEAHKQAGGDVILVTFTAPHTREESLKSLLQKFKNADSGFSKTRQVMDIKKNIGFIEPIKSLEITYGQANGWHPHSHQLWFVNSGVDCESLKDLLFPYWQSYCLKRGLEAPSLKHGLDVRNGLKAAEYVSKMGWTISKEVTKGHTKKGRKGNYAPFDLLQADIDGHQWAPEKFREYAFATFGLRYISRFPKLQKLYQVDDEHLTDEEIAQQIEERSILLGQITLLQWRKILKHDLRTTILDICEQKTFYAAMELLSAIPEIYDSDTVT